MTRTTTKITEELQPLLVPRARCTMCRRILPDDRMHVCGDTCAHLALAIERHDVTALAKFRARALDRDGASAMLTLYGAERVIGTGRWDAYERALLDVWRSVTRQVDAGRRRR